MGRSSRHRAPGPSKTETTSSGARVDRTMARRPGTGLSNTAVRALLDDASQSRLASPLPTGSTQRIPSDLNEELGSRFGADFSDVQLHTNAAAVEAAEQQRASAFTVGRHIVFGDGRYAPGTARGRTLLAHELAHVLQQHAAIGGGSAALNAEGEARAAGERTASGGSPTVSAVAPVGVQKEDDDEKKKKAAKPKKGKAKGKGAGTTGSQAKPSQPAAPPKPAPPPPTAAAQAPPPAKQKPAPKTKPKGKGKKRAWTKQRADAATRATKAKEQKVREGMTPEQRRKAEIAEEFAGPPEQQELRKKERQKHYREEEKGANRSQKSERTRHTDPLTKTRGHHGFPKYLGGRYQQVLIDLPDDIHYLYHEELDKVEKIPRNFGSDYYRRLSPAEREALFRRLIDHAERFDKKYSNRYADKRTRIAAALKRGIKEAGFKLPKPLPKAAAAAPAKPVAPAKAAPAKAAKQPPVPSTGAKPKATGPTAVGPKQPPPSGKAQAPRAAAGKAVTPKGSKPNAAPPVKPAAKPAKGASAKAPAAPKAPKAPAVPKAPKAPVVPKPPKKPVAPKAPKVAKVTQVPKALKVPKIPRVPKIPVVPRVPRIPRIARSVGGGLAAAALAILTMWLGAKLDPTQKFIERDINEKTPDIQKRIEAQTAAIEAYLAANPGKPVHANIQLGLTFMTTFMVGPGGHAESFESYIGLDVIGVTVGDKVPDDYRMGMPESVWTSLKRTDVLSYSAPLEMVEEAPQ